MKPTVLVIGARGFVGSGILGAIAASAQLEPVAGVRRPRQLSDGIAERVCDATDPRSLDTAFAGIHTVVCSVLGDAATMLSAVRNVCEAALRASPCHVVLISSMSVYGPATGLVDEDAALDGSLGAYAAAKVACERVAEAFAAAGGSISILRPGIVYGPGGEQWVGRIGRMLRMGRLGDLGEHGDGFCNLVHAHDVGAAAVAAILQGPGAGEAFNLAEADPLTWNDFLIEFGCAIGVQHVPRITPRRLRAEARLLAPPLQMMKLAAHRLRLRPGILPEPIPPSLLRLLRQRIRLDVRKADRVLGVRRTSRAAGLAAAADWFLSQEGTRARSSRFAQKVHP